MSSMEQSLLGDVVTERMIAYIARELGLSPAELRAGIADLERETDRLIAAAMVEATG